MVVLYQTDMQNDQKRKTEIPMNIGQIEYHLKADNCLSW